jgi:murein DD-endopeptidase MepM/ murein hydrolase activator NlpD
MENQVQNLKLNVTNIKSYLINSNKELRSLKIQKKNLFSKLEKQQTVRTKESRIETKNLGIGAGFSRIVGAVTAPARGIFDRILDFLGLIVLGVLVQKLPAIIAKIDEFFNSDFIKAVGNVFEAIGFGFQKLGDLIDILTPQKQKELDEELKLIGKEADEGLELASQADKDMSDLERELSKRENNNQSPASTPTMPMAPMPPGSMYPATTPQPPAPKPEDPQKFSKGGTVQATNNQQSKPAYTPRKSGPQKQAERGMENGFTDFSLAVENINETTKKDENNVIALAELSKNFREWSSLSGDLSSKRMTTPSPSLNNPVDPNDYGPLPDGTPTSGSLSSVLPQGRPQFTSGYRTANRPGHRGVDIGVDANSPVIATQDGKIVDFYRNFGDWGDAVVVKYNDGYTGIYGHVIPNSKLKIGDVIKKGQMIAKVKFWPKGVAGNTQYDDNTHLHYERKTPEGSWINPSPYLNSLTPKPKNTPIKPAQVIPLTGKGADPQLKGLKLEPVSKNGGNRTLNRLNGGGNQSMFIYAVQPVETFVPFPYPVPTQQTASLSPQKTKVPPIWRA